MLRHRKVLLVVALVLVVGSISSTLGYALHLRSDRYRVGLEERLSDMLGMRLSIGSIEPLTFTSKRLAGLTLWLPRRNVEVFRCQRALWRNESTNGETAYCLTLHHGWLLVGANEWGRADYETMLRSGFGHDFAALHLRRIQLDDIDLTWKHPSFVLTAERTRGIIRFDNDGTGRASLLADRLNNVTVDTPINIVAYFTPGDRLRFHEVVLKVPRAPLSALKLDALLGSSVTRGSFRGQISYDDRPAERSIRVSGEVRDALLSELTGPVPGGPYTGRAHITVDEALFIDRTLAALRFSGRLDGLSVGQIGRFLGRPDLSGRVDLRVHQAVFQDGAVKYLSVAGRGTDIALGALTSLIGRGRVTGSLDVVIHSLLIVDDRVVVADLTFEAVPPSDGPGTIDRRILLTASKRLLGFDAAAILPDAVQAVEYARLGVKLEFSEGELRVRGTHGRDGKTILTIKLFGREFGVIREPGKTFQVGDPIALLRRQVSPQNVQQWLHWWQAGPPPPADEPDDD